MGTAVVAARMGLCSYFDALRLSAPDWLLLESGVQRAQEIDQQLWQKRTDYQAVSTAAQLGRVLKKLLTRR